jgi:hypothetical protein
MRSRCVSTFISPYKTPFLPFIPPRPPHRSAIKWRPPPPPRRTPYTLPLGYSFYPFHNDIPMTAPPDYARIYSSTVPPPHLPRDSVFGYLFPPKVKGEPPRYYPKPDSRTIGFIDGLTGREYLREEVPVRAMWLSAGLSRNGLKRGDVVCIFGMNSLHWIDACFGAHAADLSVSPANYA